MKSVLEKGTILVKLIWTIGASLNCSENSRVLMLAVRQGRGQSEVLDPSKSDNTLVIDVTFAVDTCAKSSVAQKK